MRKLGFVLVALALVAVGPSQAWAQRQGRGGGFGGGANNVMLIGQKSVQDELKLSDDQVKQATALAEKQRTSFGQSSDLQPQERRQKAQEAARENDKAIADILKPEQLTRFKEISLQQRGAQAFNDPEVAQVLNLTSEQKEKIREIQQGSRAEMREALQAGAGGDRAEARKKAEALRASVNEKVQGVLTPEQKEKFKTLTGAPFKGEIIRPNFRGGAGAAQRARSDNQATLTHQTLRLASAAPPADEAGASPPVETRTADDSAKKDDAAGKEEARPAAPGQRGRHMRPQGRPGRGPGMAGPPGGPHRPPMAGPGAGFGQGHPFAHGGPHRGFGPGMMGHGPRGPQFAQGGHRPDGDQFAGWRRRDRVYHRRHYAGHGGGQGPAFAHHRRHGHGRSHGQWGYHHRGPSMASRGGHGGNGRQFASGRGHHHGHYGHHGRPQFGAGRGFHGHAFAGGPAWHHGSRHHGRHGAWHYGGGHYQGSGHRHAGHHVASHHAGGPQGHHQMASWHRHKGHEGGHHGHQRRGDADRNDR